MLTDQQRRDHNAHVVAYWQNKFCRGAYKPMAREHREAGHDAGRFGADDLSDTSTAQDRWEARF